MARFEGGAAIASMAEARPNVEDFFDLGLIYATGREVAADLIAAHKWFNLAAARGNRDAVRYRQELTLEMSAEQIAEAQRAAREWIRTH